MRAREGGWNLLRTGSIKRKNRVRPPAIVYDMISGHVVGYDDVYSSLFLASRHSGRVYSIWPNWKLVATMMMGDFQLTWIKPENLQQLQHGWCSSEEEKEKYYRLKLKSIAGSRWIISTKTIFFFNHTKWLGTHTLTHTQKSTVRHGNPNKFVETCYWMKSFHKGSNQSFIHNARFFSFFPLSNIYFIQYTQTNSIFRIHVWCKRSNLFNIS